MRDEIVVDRAGFQGLWAVRNRFNGNVWGGPEWGGIRYEWVAHMYQYAVPPERFPTERDWRRLRELWERL